MPKVKITQTFLLTVKPNKNKRTWYSDTVTQGLQLYVGMTGAKTWYVIFRKPNGKTYHQKIGNADLISIPEARAAAMEFLSALAKGQTPYKKQKLPEQITLRKLVDDYYASWVIENRRSGKETVAMLKSSFEKLLDLNISDFNVKLIENWQSEMRKKELKVSSINRKLTALKSLLNWAYKRDIIPDYPLRKLENLTEENDLRIRYLSEDERKRLFKALDERENNLRKARESHNKWLKARCQELLPEIKANEFADYLKPMILISLNTGIRRGSLFALRWNDIHDGTLTIRAASSKSGKTIHVPLNKIAFETFEIWKSQTNGSGENLVFKSPVNGGLLNNCKRAWQNILKKAGIKDFRWHDMRHDFASRLVMRGVDLNTVRELLGHSSMTMTLRYAHLAPEAKKRAVETLD